MEPIPAIHAILDQDTATDMAMVMAMGPSNREVPRNFLLRL